jgi:hypothetical protein
MNYVWIALIVFIFEVKTGNLCILLKLNKLCLMFMFWITLEETFVISCIYFSVKGEMVCILL